MVIRADTEKAKGSGSGFGPGKSAPDSAPEIVLTSPVYATPRVIVVPEGSDVR